MYRTHNCNELRIGNVGEEVTIAGFVSKIRNYGGLTFIDIRDHYGITQVVIRDEKLIEKYSKVPAESTIRVKGKVVERENKNPNIPTGDIEINGEEIEVLGKAANSRTQLKIIRRPEVTIKNSSFLPKYTFLK